MALKNISLPDELTGDTAVDIQALHTCISNAVNNLNYVLANIDQENMTEDVAVAINNITGGNDNG